MYIKKNNYKGFYFVSKQALNIFYSKQTRFRFNSFELVRNWYIPGYYNCVIMLRISLALMENSFNYGFEVS